MFTNVMERTWDLEITGKCLESIHYVDVHGYEFRRGQLSLLMCCFSQNNLFNKFSKNNFKCITSKEYAINKKPKKKKRICHLGLYVYKIIYKITSGM